MEYQVVVWKGNSDTYYYTLQERRRYFFYKTKWIDVDPRHCESFEDAWCLRNNGHGDFI